MPYSHDTFIATIRPPKSSTIEVEIHATNKMAAKEIIKNMYGAETNIYSVYPAKKKRPISESYEAEERNSSTSYSNEDYSDQEQAEMSPFMRLLVKALKGGMRGFADALRKM